ncbi:MAG: septum formation initiator family protein [Lachnospiraceae bacterium]|nr:septum formation initiator family protein [Lachnospiraceae bacterium]
MNQRGKKRRVNKSNRRGMLAIAGVVAFLLVVVLVQSQKLTVKNNAYQAQKAELEQQIKDEEIRAEDIEKLRDYVESDEFIEKMARDKLGLVYEDEIIFKAEE